jgi:hypothetical protein
MPGAAACSFTATVTRASPRRLWSCYIGIFEIASRDTGQACVIRCLNCVLVVGSGA